MLLQLTTVEFTIKDNRDSAADKVLEWVEDTFNKISARPLTLSLLAAVRQCVVDH